MEVQSTNKVEIILDDDTNTNDSAPAVKSFMDCLTESDKKLSRGERCKFVATNAKFLTTDEKRALGNMLIEANLKSMLKESSDGCRVALDSIADEVFIERIFAYVKFKVERKR